MSHASEAIRHMGNAVRNVFPNIMTRVWQYHYQIAGNYTFPVGTPETSKIHPLAHLFFFVFPPIVPLAWLSSLLLVPWVGNTVQSFVRSFLVLMNQVALGALPKQIPYPMIAGLSTNPDLDNRNKLRQFYGVLGYLLGTCVAAPVVTAIVIGRILGHSAMSFVRAIVSTLAFMIPSKLISHEKLSYSLDNELDTTPDKVNRFLFGGLGVVPGVVVGFILSSVFFIPRVLINTVESFFRSMGTVLRAVLPTHLAEKVRGPSLSSGMNPQEKREEFKKRYFFGAPGVLLGTLLGSILFAVPIILARIVLNTGVSFAKLCRGLANMLIGKPSYAALAQDTRPLSQKAMGAMGYVFAATLVAPFMFLAKGIITFVPVIVAAIASIFVLPVKAILKLHARRTHQSRFRENENDSVFMALKNLVSALTVGGKLPTDSAIPSGADGKKRHPILVFLRKTMTFNHSSLTEFLLGRFIKAYRDWRQENSTQTGIDEVGLSQVYAKCMEMLKNNNYRNGTTTIAEATPILDAIKTYVSDTSAEPKITSEAYSPNYSMRNLFQGARRISSEEAHSGVISRSALAATGGG